jgi:DNA polymerase-3 subunit alpha
MHIPILPPDVDESYKNFSVVSDQSSGGDSIRFGLAAVKNVGGGAIDSIIEVREKDGKYEGLQNFCERVDLSKVNKRVVESLIKCGAFDFTGHPRAALVKAMEPIYEIAQKTQKDRQNGQSSIFGLLDAGNNGGSHSTYTIPDIAEWDEIERLRLEKEGIGIYITGHPLEKYAFELRKVTTSTTATILECRDGEYITVGGVVTSFRKKLTKKGDQMGFFRLEDLEGSVEVILVPKVYERYNQMLEEDLPVLIKGFISVSEEELPKLRADKLKPLALTTTDKQQCLIELRAAGLRRQTMIALQSVLSQNHGKCPVLFKYIDGENKITRIKAGSRFHVLPSDTLKHQIEQLVGPNSVFLPQ